MNFQYIKNYYGLEFKRGQRVLALGHEGSVTSANHRVRVRLDGEKRPRNYHPTDVKPLPQTTGEK